MKKAKLLLAILSIPMLLLAQTNSTTLADKNSNILQNNIFRINITQAVFPIYETSTLSGVYEHRLKNAFTLLGKVGIGSSVAEFGIPTNRFQYSFHFYAAVEVRYYFTLNKRQKKEKSVYNFSCPYIAIEQNLFTNSIALINQTAKEAFKGSTRTFLNVGYQKQLGRFHFGTFIGTSLYSKDFSNYGQGKPLHGGAMIGYVFK